MSATTITTPVYGNNGSYRVQGAGAGTIIFATSGDPGFILNGGTLINDSIIAGGNGGVASTTDMTIGAGGTGVILAPQYGGTEPVTISGVPHGYFGGQLFNFGTIIGGHQSYYFGTLNISSRIVYGGLGVAVSTGNFLSNSGLIEGTGTGAGIAVERGALAVNYGTITGSTAARVDGGVLINAGTLSGGRAVYFAGYGGTLDVYSGAVFQGAITGAWFGNGSEIIFDEPGNNTFTGFAEVSNIDQIDLSSNWTLEGSVGSAGVTVNGGTLITAGTIRGGMDADGSRANAVIFSALVGTLVVEAGAVFEGNVVGQYHGPDVLQFGGTTAGTAFTNDGVFSGFYYFGSIDIGQAWTVQATAGTDSALVGLGTLLTNEGLIIAPGGDGAYIDGGTLINAGTIAGGPGGDAVHFGSLGGTLVVVEGDKFLGEVVANHDGQDDLIFGGAPSGTFTTDAGLFTGYSGFDRIGVSANWLVQGQAGAYGVSIGNGLTLTNEGTIAGSGTAVGAYINGGELITSGTLLSAGPVAVQFGSLAGTLALDANAVFSGSVAANRAADDALVFQGGTTGARQTSNGTFAGFSGFSTYSIGNVWSFYGAAGQVGLRIEGGTLVTNAGTVTGGAGAVGAYLDGGTLVTSGTIMGGAGAAGVYLNGGILVTSGSIAGAAGTAVAFGALAGTLEIEAGFAFSDAVTANSAAVDLLMLGGATGAVLQSTNGGLDGFYGFTRLQVGASWIVAGAADEPGMTLLNGIMLLNQGQIIAANNAIDDGLVMQAGATAVNEGLIAGGSAAQRSGFGAATETMGVGVNLSAGGWLNNTGTILGGNSAYTDDGGAGVVLGVGASLTNSGQIIGGVSGVYTGNTGGAGVVVGQGGMLANTGLVSGGAGEGRVAGPSTYGIGGVGAQIAAGGYAANSGTIKGGDSPTDGFILYQTSRIGTERAIAGAGVSLAAGGTLLNSGLIEGGDGYQWRRGGADGGDGVDLAAGASMVNDGQIAGGHGSGSAYLPPTVIASGTIIYTGGMGGVGVVLNAGASLVNHGTITGGGAIFDFGEPGNGGAGASVAAGAVLVNDGLIRGGAYGTAGNNEVYIVMGGPILGVSGAGVSMDGGTLINAGTIAGGAGADAVSFGSVGATLIVEAGAEFIGAVAANVAVADVLEFADGASLGLGDSFTGFTTMEVLAAANVTLSGTLASSVVNDGTIDTADGTTLVVAGALTGTGLIIDDPADIVLDGAVASGQTISLSGTGNTLELGDVAQFNGTITGFTFGDVLALDGFSATSAVFVAGAGLMVSNGSTAEMLNLSGSFAGEQFVLGSSASGTVITLELSPVTAGSTIALPAGSIAGATIAGGRLDVPGQSTLGALAVTGSGGEVSLSTGAVLTVAAPLAIATGATLNIAGGTLIVDGSISLTGMLTESGADLFDNGNMVNDGTIVLDPSTLTVAGSLGGTGTTTIGTDSTLDVTGDIASGQTIVFDGTDAVLGITATAAIDGTFSFVTGGTIDLTDIAPGSLASYDFDSLTDILSLTISGLANPLDFTIASTGLPPDLTATPDGNGGIDLNVMCFLTGTNIATPGGEVPVESLRIGDEVLTADGAIVPVRWVGTHTVARYFANPHRVMPVRIKAGALGEDLPRRDLLVSPDHAVYLDGILVQAGALVNGISIIREMTMPEYFMYYHIETPGHALILAEGAATETFVDNVDRMAFDNWAEHEALYGNDTAIAEMPYPRAKSLRQVPTAIRRTLAQRASFFALPAVA